MANIPNIYDPAVFCDSTVFSDISDLDFDPLSPNVSQMLPVPSEAALTKAVVKNNGIFPVLPPSHNFSALGNPDRFKTYIQNELPAALHYPLDASSMPPPGIPIETPNAKLRRKEVNTTFLNTLLVKPQLFSSISPAWITEAVFSDSKLNMASPSLEFKPDNIVGVPQLWNGDKATGTLYDLPAGITDPEVRAWLNALGNNLAAAHSFTIPPATPADRVFDSSTSTVGPSGAYALFKPDLVLVKWSDMNISELEERVQWRNVFAVVEVTSKKSNALQHVLRQISQKASCVFDVQPQRSFVCALGIYGTEPKKISYTFVVVDCVGVKYTEPSAIVGYHGLYFLRAIFAFFFGSATLMGWDPTMDVDAATNEVRKISVTGFERNSAISSTRKFSIVKLIHNSPVLFGRGTRVWIVKDEEGRFYVLKDSWILKAGSVSEIHLIKHIEMTVEGDPDGPLFKHACPTYFIGQDCVHSTNTIRNSSLDLAGTRCQRRIVTGPIGDPITSFRSKQEFITVCLDLVNVLEFLDKKALVVHGDLSANNVMINRVWDHGPDDSPSQLRAHALSGPYQSNIPLNNSLANVLQNPAVSNVDHTGTVEYIESSGMIIDCDFMQHIGHSSHRTSGTLPFMALEALKASPTTPFTHHARHDLECLLNTILVVCNYTVGPNGQLRQPLDIADAAIKLNRWFVQEDRNDLALWKSITLEAFKSYIKPTLPTYWQDFAPFLYRLIETTWASKPFIEHPNVATHQAYHDILIDALNHIQDGNKPAPYAQVQPEKRPREDPKSLPSRKQQRLGEGIERTRHSKAHRLESFVESSAEPQSAVVQPEFIGRD